MKQHLQSIKKRIAAFFDGVAMYRTVTLSLLSLAACALYLGAVGEIPYTFSEQLFSLLTLLGTGYVTNFAISFITKIPANHESAIITALIIFFLFVPPASYGELYIPALAVAIAIISKFVLAYRKQHIFNAAALGAVAISFLGFQDAWWWVAQPELLVPLLVAGVIVVNKIRRWPMVGMFIAVGLGIVVAEAFFITGAPLWETAYRFLVTGPVLFLGFFMLTEPFTTPGTRIEQLAYAALAAFLVNTTLFINWFAISPELALLIANFAVWPWLLRQKLFFVLEGKREVAKQTYEFTFKKPAGFTFIAGQYLEWMLPHQKADSRGIRRYFTIASAPHEPVVKLAVRMTNTGGSSFKRSLRSLTAGDTLVSSQRAGDFSLPYVEPRAYGFIAGGIGITPFISMLKARAHGEQGTLPPVTLFYANNTYEEIAYRDELAVLTQTQPLTIVHALTKESHEGCIYGFLTKEHILEYAPDARERRWYLSGPPPMVNAYKALLSDIGVPRRAMVTDYFPGLA